MSDDRRRIPDAPGTVTPPPRRPCRYFIGAADAPTCERCTHPRGEHYRVWRPPEPSPTFDDLVAKAPDKETTEAFRRDYVPPPPPDKFPWEIESEKEDAREAAQPETKPEGEAAPPRFVTSAQYLAEESDPEPSLLGDCLIVKGGVHVVASEPGLCKTSFLRQLAVCLSAGVEVHGLAVPRKVRVALFEAEGNRDINRERFRTLIAALGIKSEVIHLGRNTSPPQIEKALAPPQISADGRLVASEEIGGEMFRAVSETRTELNCLDTAGYFDSNFDENSASDWKRYIFRPLREIARALPWHPAFLLSHHFGKPNEHRSGADRVRGSSAIKGDSDTLITFEPASGGDRIIQPIIQKFEKVKGPPMEDRVLVLDRKTGILRWDQDGNAAAVAEPRMVTVVEIVEAAGEIKTATLVAALRKRAKISERTAETLIASTLKHGLIAQPKRGTYAPREKLFE